MHTRSIRPLAMAGALLLMICLLAMNINVAHAETISDETPSVEYSAHVQNIGWQDAVADGEMAGTSGKSLRMEAMKIEITNDTGLSGDIEYRSHVQNIGWESDWKSASELTGTSGQSLRLEAIQVRLTGELAEQYDVYYCVHAQQFGWLAWAKNGEMAGSAGYSYRLEGIKIMLVKKGEAAPANPGTRSNAFEQKSTTTSTSNATSNAAPAAPVTKAPSITYQAHVQSIGWQAAVTDGELAGTSGKSLRVEALTVTGLDAEESGTVQYRTHVQNIGWESSWKSVGETTGTSGKSLRLEAIQMQLTGELAQNYDIYYCVHAQNVGWLAWAKNGEIAGTTGCSFRLEGIKVMLVKKGSAAPTNLGTNAFKAMTSVTKAQYDQLTNTKGQQVVAYARQFIGNPYVYGGSSLTNGTDCSGFTMSVMKHFGVYLPHGSNSQRKYGTHVNSYAEAKPGDLLFFSGHVGIYTGNGMMVHASQPGVGIVETPVRYSGTVIEVRRYV